MTLGLGVEMQPGDLVGLAGVRTVSLQTDGWLSDCRMCVGLCGCWSEQPHVWLLYLGRKGYCNYFLTSAGSICFRYGSRREYVVVSRDRIL